MNQNLGDVYDKGFFDAQVAGSLASGRICLTSLFSIWRPGSVADLGCGRGAWLTACHELGVATLAGIDGAWASKAGMLIEEIEFHPKNLNQPVDLGRTFDMAISLEVGEHVEPGATDIFHRSLTGLSGAVMFSAAFTGQPGANHINTRPHSFWAAKFQKAGYRIFDFFRPKLWGDSRIEPWYRQNAFLYVKPDHPLDAALQGAGEQPMKDAAFTDCIHPYFHFAALDEIARLNGAGFGHAHGQPAMAPRGPKPGRNDPCSCGSGRKFKHCHGKSI